MNNTNTILDKYFSGKCKISSSELRKKLLKFNYKQRKCEICHIETWLDNPAPLELHHINGNHNDNSLENLQIVCPNCHSFTGNYRGLKQRRAIIRKTVEEILKAIKDSYNARNCLIKLGYHPKGGNYARIYSVMEKYGATFRQPTEEEVEMMKQNRDEATRKRWNEFRDLAAKEGRVYVPKRETKFKSKEELWLASRRVNRPSRDELLEMAWKESISTIAKRLGVSDNAVRKWAQQYQIPVPPVGYWAKFNNGHFDKCAQIKEDLFKAFNIE